MPMRIVPSPRPVAEQRRLFFAAVAIARDRTQPLYTRRRALQVARFWQMILIRRKLVHGTRLTA